MKARFIECGNTAWVVEWLSAGMQGLNIPSGELLKAIMVVHIRNPSTQEVEAGDSQVQS